MIVVTRSTGEDLSGDGSGMARQLELGDRVPTGISSSFSSGLNENHKSGEIKSKSGTWARTAVVD